MRAVPRKFQRPSLCATGWPVKPGLNLPRMRLPTRTVRMIVTKPATRPKSLNMTALRMPPTMHIRLRWQSAPTTRPATSARPHAACMLPGPFSENLKIAGAASQRTNSST